MSATIVEPSGGGEGGVCSILRGTMHYKCDALQQKVPYGPATSYWFGINNREDAYSRTGGISYGTAYGIFIVIQ